MKDNASEWLHEDYGKPAPILVLGLGNVLIEDEGIGIAAIEYLNNYYKFGEEVELLDGGTSGMALLDDIRSRNTVIILDAVSTGHQPGEMVILRNEEVPVFLCNKVSPHQLALSDVLAILSFTDEQPKNIAIIGVEPVSLKTHIGLSPKVRQQLEPMINEVLSMIRATGYSVPEKSDQILQETDNPFHLV